MSNGAKGKGTGLKVPLDPYKPSRNESEADRFKALYEKYRRDGCDHDEAFEIAGDVIKFRKADAPEIAKLETIA